MNDMLAAFHFVRYLELRRKEEEPCREVVAEKRFPATLQIFRRLRWQSRQDEN